jgi:hypothetical protein
VPMTSSLNCVPRSKIREPGAESNANASRNCWIP